MSLINLNVRINWVQWLKDRHDAVRGQYAELLDDYEKFCRDLGGRYYIRAIDLNATATTLHLSVVTNDGMYHLMVPATLAPKPSCKKVIEATVDALCALR